MENTSPLRRAVQILGGVVATAKTLNLKSYQVVQQWLVTQVPTERCPDIEQATNGQVTCEELRPDLAEQWAYLRGTQKRAA
jgi:DNA-binding transcriptional regulator YdaS (Cro superfamily)